MKADGRLERRLTESLADALAVAGSALNRGLHISQALELAKDAVSLPRNPDPDEEDEEE